MENVVELVIGNALINDIERILWPFSYFIEFVYRITGIFQSNKILKTQTALENIQFTKLLL